MRWQSDISNLSDAFVYRSVFSVQVCMYVYTCDALGHSKGMRHTKPEVCSKLVHYIIKGSSFSLIITHKDANPLSEWSFILCNASHWSNMHGDVVNMLRQSCWSEVTSKLIPQLCRPCCSSDLVSTTMQCVLCAIYYSLQSTNSLVWFSIKFAFMFVINIKTTIIKWFCKWFWLIKNNMVLSSWWSSLLKLCPLWIKIRPLVLAYRIFPDRHNNCIPFWNQELLADMWGNMPVSVFSSAERQI